MLAFTFVVACLLTTFVPTASPSRVECNVVLECDPLSSCYSLKGGFPFIYENEKQGNWNAGKKYSMFLARNVETVRCVLLDKYEF